MHAAFGDGVVTGVEPGGVIVVRFAGDGTERKLMAEFARHRAEGFLAAVLSRRRIHRKRIGSHAPMSATIIDGKAIAARVRAEVAEEVRGFVGATGRAPGLATVLVGDDPASAVYVGGKQRACAEVGMTPFDQRLPADASFEQVAEMLERAQRRRAVSGVLLQLPVPAHLDGPTLTGMIDPDKDVDGLTPVNAGLLSLGGRACGPARRCGVMELLASAWRASCWRAPRRSSSGAPTCSASRWRSCCSPPTRPSRSATRAPATSRRSAPAPTS